MNFRSSFNEASPLSVNHSTGAFFSLVLFCVGVWVWFCGCLLGKNLCRFPVFNPSKPI